MDGSLVHLSDLFKGAHGLNSHLKGTLSLWATYGMTNTALSLLLNMSLAQSTLLYVIVMFAGFSQASLPLLEKGKQEESSEQFLRKTGPDRLEFIKTPP
jgi:hypothetical protein